MAVGVATYLPTMPATEKVGRCGKVAVSGFPTLQEVTPRQANVGTLGLRVPNVKMMNVTLRRQAHAMEQILESGVGAQGIIHRLRTHEEHAAIKTYQKAPKETGEERAMISSRTMLNPLET